MHNPNRLNRKNETMKHIYFILILLIHLLSLNKLKAQCVNDTIAPVAICKNTLTVYLDSSGTVEVQAKDVDDNSFDNCGIEKYQINGDTVLTLSCLNIGSSVPVSFVVKDTTGNTDTCNTFIVVVDNLPPEPNCASIGAISIPLGILGTVTFPLGQAIAGSSDNCSIATTLINNQAGIPTLTCDDVGIYPYTVQMIDSSGNVGWCQSQIEVLWSITCGFTAQLDSLGRTQCDTGACNGYAALSSNGGIGIVNYLWEDGSTAIIRNDLCAGEHIVVATDLLGNVDTLVFNIRYESGCVWPGDTDDNTKANNFDLLPIALAYGTLGGARAGASINWTGQSSNDWNLPLALPVLPDYKFIDCNGDGLIDSSDVEAIRLNYAQSYSRNSSTTTNSMWTTRQDPPIYVDCDTVYEGDVHCMGVNLGEPSREAINAYAIAFTINYDPLLVHSATISYGSSWLGAAQELISVEKDYAAQGKLETAVGRTDQQPLTGSGRLGTVCFTIRDDILRVSQPDTTVMPVDIDGIRFVDENGNEMPTEPREGCVTIVEVMNDINNVKTFNKENQINLYPNPTTGWVKITGLEQRLQKITVRTVTGEVLLSKTVQSQGDLELDLNYLPEAVYLVSMETSDKIINKRLLIIRG